MHPRPTPLKLAAFIVSLVTLAAPVHLFGGAGDLDCTFGAGGFARGPAQAGDQMASDMLVQPDGRIVVVGGSLAARYAAAGALDPTFGTGGVADLSSLVPNGMGVAMDASGRLVIGGMAPQTGGTRSDVVVARLLADGSPDFTFGSGGRVLVEFGSPGVHDSFADLAVDSQGRIVVGGTNDANYNYPSNGFGLAAFAVARLTDSGALDTAFAGDGIWMETPVTNPDHNMGALILLADDRILVGGNEAFLYTPGQPVNSLVARLTTAGALDPTFSGDGYASWDGGTPTSGYNNDSVADLGLDSLGRIVVASVSTSQTGVISRLLADGSLDSSFASGGLTAVNFDGQISMNRLLVQADDKPIVTGLTYLSSSFGWKFAMARFTAAGAYDATFGGDGRVWSTYSTTNQAYASALQADGKILLAGGGAVSGPNGWDFQIARYLNDGHDVGSQTVITSHAPDPSVAGQPVSVQWSVTAGSGTPAGTVTVSDGVASCSAPVENGGCALTLTTVGTRTLTATYSGSPQLCGSAATASHVVTSATASTTTTITAHTPNPSVVGQPVIVSVSVTSTSGTPAGTVVVGDGAGASCSISLAGGTGSCTLTPLVAGTRTWTATFSGTGFSGSSGTVSHTANKVPTATTIASVSPEPSAPGQPVTVAVSVSSAFGSPSGSVIVSDGTSSCSAPLAGGAGSCALTFAAPGPVTITATFAGSATHLGSSAAAPHQVVDVVAPVFVSVNASTTILWPPNHKMHPVSFTAVAQDDFDPAPAIAIVGVTVNELDNGKGDGNTTDDWTIDGMTVWLRSERAGKGNGREYRVLLEARDAAGNASTTAVVIRAPQHQ